MVEFTRQDADAEMIEGVSSPPNVVFFGIIHVFAEAVEVSRTR